MELTFVTAAELLIAANGVLLAVGLVGLRIAGRRASLLLAVLFLLFSLLMAGELSHQLRTNLTLAEVRAALPLAFGPLLFLYFRNFLRPDRTLNGLDALHTIPFFIACGFLRAEYYFFWDLSIHYYALASAISVTIYAIAAIAMAVRNRAALVTRQRRVWMIFAGMTCLALLGLLSVSAHFNCDLELVSPGREIRFALLGTIVVLMNLMLFGGFWEPSILFTGRVFSRATAKPQEIAALVQLVENEQCYLDSTLSAESLAEKLGMTARQASRLIQLHYKLSFPALLNRLRVEEAKRLIRADIAKPLLDVAFEAGFNSKSTFNRVFREQTGMSPTKFRSTVERAGAVRPKRTGLSLPVK